MDPVLKGSWDFVGKVSFIQGLPTMGPIRGL